MEILQVIVKLFRNIVFGILPKSFQRYVDPDSSVGDAVGLFVALLVVTVFVLAIGFATDQLDIDKCLDSGGK